MIATIQLVPPVALLSEKVVSSTDMAGLTLTYGFTYQARSHALSGSAHIRGEDLPSGKRSMSTLLRNGGIIAEAERVEKLESLVFGYLAADAKEAAATSYMEDHAFKTLNEVNLVIANSQFKELLIDARRGLCPTLRLHYSPSISFALGGVARLFPVHDYHLTTPLIFAS